MEEIIICCIAFSSVVYLMPPSIDIKTKSLLIDFRKRIEDLEKKIAELEKEKKR